MTGRLRVTTAACALACALSVPFASASASAEHVELTETMTKMVTTKAPEVPADFLTEQHGFLRVVYHPSLFEAVRRAVHDADANRAALASALGQNVLERTQPDSVEVRIARTPGEMAVLAPADAPPAPGANGTAYASLGLIVLSARTSDGAVSALDLSFRHELAHVALHDATAGQTIPRWLQEGFAVVTSDETPMRRMHAVALAHHRGALASFGELRAFPTEPAALRIAYAQSADFVEFLMKGDGHARFAAAISAVRSGVPLDRALDESYGADARGLEQRWKDDVARRFVTVPLAVAAVVGWGLAAWAAVVVLRRRRQRRARSGTRPAIVTAESFEFPPAFSMVNPLEPKTSEPRLLVCERGLGHVVYIVERKSVPKVEHDGKRHTLH